MCGQRGLSISAARAPSVFEVLNQRILHHVGRWSYGIFDWSRFQQRLKYNSRQTEVLRTVQSRAALQVAGKR